MKMKKKIREKNLKYRGMYFASAIIINKNQCNSSPQLNSVMINPIFVDYTHKECDFQTLFVSIIFSGFLYIFKFDFN